MILRAPFAPAPGQPVTLVEGAAFYAEVDVYSKDPAHVIPAFEFRVVTDAPPDQLRMPDFVVPTVGAPPHSGLATFPVEALLDGVEEGPQRYSIQLERPDLLRPADALTEGTIEVVVMDARAVNCAAFRFDVQFREGGGEEHPRSGELRLEAPHFATTVSILSPYVPVPSTVQIRIPRIAELSPDAFSFRRVGEGFDTTIPLRWLRDLELAAEAPGCPPVGVECDGRGCRPS